MFAIIILNDNGISRCEAFCRKNTPPSETLLLIILSNAHLIFRCSYLQLLIITVFPLIMAPGAKTNF